MNTQSTGDKTATAKVQAGVSDVECRVQIGGDWRLNERVPSWKSVFQNRMAMNLVCGLEERVSRRSFAGKFTSAAATSSRE